MAWLAAKSAQGSDLSCEGCRAFLSNHAIQSCLDQYERTWRKAKLWGVVKNPGIIIISLNLYFLHVSNGLSWSTVIKCRSQWQQLGKKLWIFDVLHRPDLWRMQNHCSGTVTVELLMFAYAGMPQNASRFLLTSWSVVSTFFNCAGHKVVFCLSQEGQDGHQFCVRHRNQRST